MVKVNIKAIEKEIEVERVVGDIAGKKKSPTLVFIAGIHGNETSGVYAIQKVLKKIEENKIEVKGNILALSGNLNALKNGERFTEEDLNRVWTLDHIKYFQTSLNGFSKDTVEQIALFEIIKKRLDTDNGPFYFIDLHSTSAKTNPFVTISDSLNNRKYSSKFPVPTILGIEEHIDGPLLSYINEFGHVSLGFESGQHDAIEAIKCSEAFIWLSLVNANCIKLDKREVKKWEGYLESVSPLSGQFFEIDYRFPIHKNHSFKMKDGFKNFDKIKKNQVLATENQQNILAPFNGRVFMPLYQNKGEDGFFVVTKISKFWLVLSTFFRKLHFHQLLRLLPGIRQSKFDKHTLIINHRTAKYLATEIFHLFGYRKKVLKDEKWLFTKRDRKVTPFH